MGLLIVAHAAKAQTYLVRPIVTSARTPKREDRNTGGMAAVAPTMIGAWYDRLFLDYLSWDMLGQTLNWY